MPLIYIDDGYPESGEYSTNYYWVDPDELEETLQRLGGREALVIRLPPDQDRQLASSAHVLPSWPGGSRATSGAS